MPSSLPSSVSVVMPLKQQGLSAEMTQAIYRDLKNLDIKTNKVHDGDPAALKSEVILFAADPRHFPEYEALLPTIAHRPRTVLWLMEPLPPSDGDSKWGKRGLELVDEYLRLRKRYQKLGWPILSAERRYKNAKKLARSNTLGRWEDMADTYKHTTGHKWEEINGKSLLLLFTTLYHLRGAMAHGWIDQLWVSTEAGRKSLAKFHLDANVAIAGYHELSGEVLTHDRNIDVMFIGNPRGRHRQACLSKLGKQLHQWSMRFEVVNHPCWGRDRTEVLNQAKIVLHLHQYRWDTPWIRLVMASACGAMMVSEPMVDPRPFTPGQHYIEVPVENMAKTILWYVQNPQQAANIADRADKYIRRQLTLRQSLVKILTGKQ